MFIGIQDVLDAVGWRTLLRWNLEWLVARYLGRFRRTVRNALPSERVAPWLTRAAGLLAGRRHGHLRAAWEADLWGDPETGEAPSTQKRLRLAAGFVVAALRCRLDDAAALVWRPVDLLLSSWHGSNLAVLLPATIAVGLVLPREGFYGLIANAENLGVIAAAPYAAIRGLRKYRQIDAPKRPEKKAESASSSKR
jgi:hypothetical protein